jgi:thioredoxin reductase
MCVEPHDALIIGGGQAGLAAAYHLKRAKRHFLILDAAVQTGARGLNITRACGSSAGAFLCCPAPQRRV